MAVEDIATGRIAAGLNGEAVRTAGTIVITYINGEARPLALLFSSALCGAAEVRLISIEAQARDLAAVDRDSIC